MPHTVLFVDDVPAVTAALKRRLRDEPYRILEAGSAEEALAILDREPVDVVVSDDAMPGMSGTSLLGRLYETHPTIIGMILTGRPTIEAAIKAINEGKVYRFFTKPCDPVDLAVTIRQALGEKALLAENRRLRRSLDEQGEQLRRLEADNPGITTVRRDPTGAVILD
jgi:two-component system, probable response regulator PhcQ